MKRRSYVWRGAMGGVHLDELHYGGGLNVGEAVKGGHFAGEVLIQRAVVWADQCRDQVGLVTT